MGGWTDGQHRTYIPPPFLTDFSYIFFTVLKCTFMIEVRQYVNNLESSVVVQELELVINLALCFF